MFLLLKYYTAIICIGFTWSTEAQETHSEDIGKELYKPDQDIKGITWTNSILKKFTTRLGQKVTKGK